jgi:hypothetical protein
VIANSSGAAAAYLRTGLSNVRIGFFLVMATISGALTGALLMITWGGWVRGATARSMAEAVAEEAVVKHLAPICVVQFQQDPAKDQKLKALRDLSAYERGDYVKKQGWAKMPGEVEADGKVADECAKLITS